MLRRTMWISKRLAIGGPGFPAQEPVSLAGTMQSVAGWMLPGHDGRWPGARLASTGAAPGQRAL
jgi:hypothetical protein